MTAKPQGAQQHLVPYVSGLMLFSIRDHISDITYSRGAGDIACGAISSTT